jgi:hypothetical protein
MKKLLLSLLAITAVACTANLIAMQEGSVAVEIVNQGPPVLAAWKMKGSRHFDDANLITIRQQGPRGGLTRPGDLIINFGKAYLSTPKGIFNIEAGEGKIILSRAISTITNQVNFEEITSIPTDQARIEINAEGDVALQDARSAGSQEEAIRREAQKNEPYYRIMGLPVGASKEEVRSAYKALSIKWHPDRNQNNPAATEMFKKIAEAHEKLTESK